MSAFIRVILNMALYALVMHALLFLPPTILAAVFLPREGIGSLRELRSRVRTSSKSPRQDDRQEG